MTDGADDPILCQFPTRLEFINCTAILNELCLDVTLFVILIKQRAKLACANFENESLSGFNGDCQIIPAPSNLQPFGIRLLLSDLSLHVQRVHNLNLKRLTLASRTVITYPVIFFPSPGYACISGSANPCRSRWGVNSYRDRAGYTVILCPGRSRSTPG